MTKLEQKLIELGYKLVLGLPCYEKRTDKGNIEIIVIKNEIRKAYIRASAYKVINSQQDIDNLQQAFNQLQSDLKELNEDENI